MKRWVMGVCLALASACTMAGAVGPGSYGQSLVAPALAVDSAVRSLTLHGFPPGATQAVVIAASDTARIGKPSNRLPPGRLPAPAQPVAEESSASRVVVLPLLDVSGDTIGVLEVGFGVEAGVAAIQRAERVRDWLHRRISHVANLLDPVPYDPEARFHTRAQQLSDQVLARHPEVLIFAIHATPPESDYNVIAGSNIGRIGKKADNDDMRCVYTGKPNLEVNSTGRRFEVEMQLHDAKGTVIGAVSVVFGYKAGDDKEALHKAGETIRAELERQIPNSASLFETAVANPPLVMAGRTDLPGYTGDFDHFEVDFARDRLLLAAEDHGTLEVFGLHSGKHLRSIKGFDTPHSLFLVPGSKRLLVADGSESIKILDAETYARTGEIRTHPGADSVGYDATNGHLFVVTGGKDVKLEDSWLEDFDPKTGVKAGETHFLANHVEAFAVEQGGARVYVNITDKNQLAVVNRDSHAVEAMWPIREAEQNAMVQLDPASKQLFVVARKPGKVIVMDATSGATRATFGAPGHSDQALFDAANRRLYAPGGEGAIGVYSVRDDGHVVALEPVPSASGAKTGILVPELHRLYLAVSPGEGKSGAAVIWFDVNPNT